LGTALDVQNLDTMFVSLDPVDLVTVTGAGATAAATGVEVVDQAVAAGLATAERAAHRIDPDVPHSGNIFGRVGRKLANATPRTQAAVVGTAGLYGAGKNLIKQANDAGLIF
jgi:hypothetical protein